MTIERKYFDCDGKNQLWMLKWNIFKLQLRIILKNQNQACRWTYHNGYDRKVSTQFLSSLGRAVNVPNFFDFSSPNCISKSQREVTFILTKSFSECRVIEKLFKYFHSNLSFLRDSGGVSSKTENCHLHDAKNKEGNVAGKLYGNETSGRFFFLMFQRLWIEHRQRFHRLGWDLSCVWSVLIII